MTLNVVWGGPCGGMVHPIFLFLIGAVSDVNHLHDILPVMSSVPPVSHSGNPQGFVAQNVPISCTHLLYPSPTRFRNMYYTIKAWIIRTFAPMYTAGCRALFSIVPQHILSAYQVFKPCQVFLKYVKCTICCSLIIPHGSTFCLYTL